MRRTTKEPTRYTDEQIAAVLDAEIEAHKDDPKHCIRPRYVAYDIMGISAKTRNKRAPPSSLTTRIRTMAAARGWEPDPTDQTHGKNTRLYKVRENDRHEH